jgi:predicted aldo/keto reductase-like oxidoreductase
MTRIVYGARLLGVMGKPAYAGLCRNCGKCIAACPQHISIPDELQTVSRTLDGLRTRIFMPLFMFMFSREVKDE